MKAIHLIKTQLMAVLLAATPSGTQATPLLADGDFEDLPAGTAPDKNAPAGHWSWPAHYLLTGDGKNFSESFASQFTIAPAPGGAGGHALHSNFAASDPGPGTVLPNILTQPVTASSAEFLSVSFDIFVAPGRGGGDVFLSNGRLLQGQFGPYLHWRGDVAKVYFLKPEGYLALLDYSQGVWQSVRLNIDMVQSRFDLEWSERGRPVSVTRTGMPFTGAPPHLDRIEISRNAGESVDAYYDNVRVTTDPVITPPTLDLAQGTSATLKVANGKAGSTIQWQRNGANIAGATTSTLELGSVTAEQAGSYTAVVSFGGQSTTTESSTVRVFDKLTITTPPQDVQVATGTATGFAVAATSALPLTYQWQFKGVNLPGKTTRFLTVPNVTLAAQGAYTVVVSDATGSVVSDSATLTVLVVPGFSQAPLSQSVVEGGSVTFSAAVTGNPGPFWFQWRKGSSFAASTVIATEESSEKTAFFTLHDVQPSAAGTYLLHLANPASPAFTSSSPVRSFTLTVLPDTDADGLPDDWESSQGLNPNDPSDAPGDADGDGDSNLSEYRSGTKANDASSRLTMEGLALTNGQASLAFRAAAGKTYSVEWNNGLDGSWQKLADVVAAPLDRLENVIDPSPAGERRFYRVSTPRRP